MGKNPNVIFRELYRKAKKRHDAVIMTGAEKDFRVSMEEQDHCYYTAYNQVVKAFIIEGHSEQKADKHIMQWVDNDLLSIRLYDGWRYIGFYEDL